MINIKKYKKIKNINVNLEKQITNLNRQFLHANTLGFIHPKTNKEMILHQFCHMSSKK